MEIDQSGIRLHLLSSVNGIISLTATNVHIAQIIHLGSFFKMGRKRSNASMRKLAPMLKLITLINNDCKSIICFPPDRCLSFFESRPLPSLSSVFRNKMPQ